MGRVIQSTNEVPVVVDPDGAGSEPAVEQVTAECFSYDGFNRLVGAWTVADEGAVTCDTSAPADAAATGWDASGTAYAGSWSYSAGGRITGLTSAINGAAAVTKTYGYADVTHPAAVTAVSGGPTLDQFTYDTAGRMMTRTVDGVTTNLTWDVTSSLTETNGQGGRTVYAYDASGQRVVQATVARPADGFTAAMPGTATGYVASGQVDDTDTSATSTGTVTATRYYTFGGATVAIRTNDGKLALMLGDEQGSTSVMMPVTLGTGGAMLAATVADASAVTRTAYTPYGALRGDDNEATDSGWLGQIEDRADGAGSSTTGTGLTYLNARYYDPTTMRFISPDPLMNPGDPKTLDPYRYADNNPVMFTDARGLWPEWGDLGGFWSEGEKGATIATYDSVMNLYALGLVPGMPDMPWMEDRREVMYRDFETGVREFGWATQIDRTFNPVHQMLDTGNCAWTAAQAGDGYSTGYCTASFTIATTNLVTLAAGGAKFVGSRVTPGAIAMEAGAEAPPKAVPAVVSEAPHPGFSSFKAAKRNLGPLPSGYVFDHVVEQCQANISRSGFASEVINNPNNLAPVTAEVNQIKANYFSSIQDFSRPLTVRNWLNNQSFAAQRDFGLQALQDIQRGKIK